MPLTVKDLGKCFPIMLGFEMGDTHLFVSQ
jgi:hypothetical protein